MTDQEQFNRLLRRQGLMHPNPLRNLGRAIEAAAVCSRLARDGGKQRDDGTWYLMCPGCSDGEAHHVLRRCFWSDAPSNRCDCCDPCRFECRMSTEAWKEHERRRMEATT